MSACKCKRVIAALSKLGAVHAARMHYLLATGQATEWSPEDWEMHFREEETLLFPRLLQLGKRDAVARLSRDHTKFRSELARFGRITSLDSMKKHSEAEDQILLSLGL